ncbi:MAG: pyruvate dehydrogenase component alpha subunit [Gammaproteobacteria bacterium]|nr:pyruvate dehydrogenase component alpha subunit [Gammaproteobacteria bacterium]
MNVVATFTVTFTQILNEQGDLIQPLPDFAKDAETLIMLYRQMHMLRALDARAVIMQRTGKMGTYPSALGQEAVSIGMGAAMHKDDIFVPYYRDQGAMMQRGVTPTEILNYWGGDERASNFITPEAKEDFPICICISTQLLHAAGVAYALSLRGEKRAVVTGCGDGGTSEGDFYESINFAGAQRLPIVYVINNNQWAISVPRNKQTSTQTLAQKAFAGGFEGIQVDGNDVIAVRHVVEQALEKARKGGGPTLIEAITYRLCDHTTVDDASRYVDKPDLDKAWELEPFKRFYAYLEKEGLWDAQKEKALQEECSARMAEAAQACIHTAPAQPTDIIDYMYETLPASYQYQRDELSTAKLPEGH